MRPEMIAAAGASRFSGIAPTTRQLSDWNPGADGFVKALGVSNGTVFAGGNFTSVGGAAHANLVAIDAAIRRLMRTS